MNVSPYNICLTARCRFHAFKTHITCRPMHISFNLMILENNHLIYSALSNVQNNKVMAIYIQNIETFQVVINFDPMRHFEWPD